MDQQIIANLSSCNGHLMTNIFFVGERNQNSPAFLEEVQFYFNFSWKKATFDKNEIEVFYSTAERNSLNYSFFAVKNINIFVNLQQLLKKCRRNIVFLHYENLDFSVQDFLSKSKERIIQLEICAEVFSFRSNFAQEIKDKNFAESISIKFLAKNLITSNPIFDIILKEKKCLFEATPRKAKIKKVFHIVKVPQQKKQLRKALKLVKLRSPFSKSSTLTNSNKNSKSSKAEEDDKEDNFNSLIKISKEVFDFIKSRGEVSGQNVTEYYNKGDRIHAEPNWQEKLRNNF
jgi:hypothetical protein